MKRKLFTLLMLLVSVFAVVAISNTADAAQPTKVYLKPGVWSSSNAYFEAWTWGGSTGDSWVTFSDDDGDGIYVAELAAGRTGMKILRKSPSHASKSWNSWNDSGDQTIPTDGKNMFVVSDWNKYTWDIYTYVAPEFYLMGTLTDWSNGAKLNGNDSDKIYQTSLELTPGTYEFKVKDNSNNWYGGGTKITDQGSAKLSDGDNCKLIVSANGLFNFSYSSSNKTLTITSSLYKDQLKAVITPFYNNGVYTRTTNIFIDKEAIASDFGTHFHNPKDGDNVLLERTTEFVGNYLYFVETNVAFGTSAEGELVEFTWNGEYDNSAAKGNAIEDTFVTLYDFMNLAEGWTVVDGKYVNTTAAAFDAAEAFTAPGWQSPAAAYTDYTQVVVYESEGKLVIELYVSATNSGIVTSNPVGAHALFSKAIIG